MSSDKIAEIAQYNNAMSWSSQVLSDYALELMKPRHRDPDNNDSGATPQIPIDVGSHQFSWSEDQKKISVTVNDHDDLNSIATDALLAQGNLNPTAAQIAQETNEIAMANQLSASSVVHAGDKLTVPNPTDPVAVAEFDRTLYVAQINYYDSHGMTNSWQEAIAYQSLGMADNSLGRTEEAKNNLRTAVTMMKTDIQSDAFGNISPAQAEGQLDLTEWQLAQTLTTSDPTDKETATQIMADRTEANSIYTDILKQKDLAPTIRAEVLDAMATNQIENAGDFYKLHADPSDPAKNKEVTAEYQQMMQEADDNYQKALDALKLDKPTNDAVTQELIASQALILGDRGFERMHRANAPHDQFAEQAAQDFNDSWSLWKSYQPAGRTAADSRDQAMITMLAGYDQLLKAQGASQADIKNVEDAIAEILRRQQPASNTFDSRML